MRDHLNSLLAEVGESFDAVRSDVRRLDRYASRLEELIESSRVFVADVPLLVNDIRSGSVSLLVKDELL